MPSTIDSRLLQSLAVGSLGGLLLVGGVCALPPASRKDAAYTGEQLAPTRAEAIDVRTFFVSDSIWIGVLGSEGTTITRTMPGERSAEPEIAEIPQSLRRSTGLGVEVLAKAVGVSKVTYHKWLKGAGISEDSKDRLSALLQTFAVLASIRTDLRRFLDRQTPAGTPLELLAQQKDALVIGLALRGDVDFVERPPMVSEGTLGLSPVRPIGWATAVDRERLEDFRPSGAFDEPADVPEEDEPIGVEAVFFGTHRPA